jgi:hypothetical protein
MPISIQLIGIHYHIYKLSSHQIEITYIENSFWVSISTTLHTLI